MSSLQVFTAFQGGQGAALAAVVLFAIISLAAVDFVWLRMLVVGVNQLLGRGSMQAIKRERAIFHSQLGAYMASLLLSNLLSSIAIIINATWVSQGGITAGGLCTSQATLSQIADVAGAYFTGAIAVHTFTSLVLKYRLPLWVVSGLVLGGWAIAIILAIFPIGTQTRLGPFYTVNGLTCDISPQYPLFETVIHLVPIFIAAIVAAIFYSLVFLILRGTIAIHGGLKLNLDYEARRSTMYDNHEYPRFIAAIARSMLWYPVAYVVLMFPHLITCLLHASGFKVSDTGRVVTAATSSLLGLANVLIFYNIIRIMGPAFDGTGSKASSEKSIGEKSFIANPSPVDVAPPVAAIRAPARAFPPPRSIVSERSFETFGSGHTRQASSISSAGGDSTRRLLPAAHLRQGRFDSPASHEIGRSITPVSELNEMITNSSERAVPRLIVNVPDHQNSLPAPRRNGRSPVVRNPSVISPIHPSAMMAVPLTGRKTPGSPESAYPASQRNSFINMYASNDQVPAMPTFAFNSPGYSSSSPASDGEESDVPRSAFSQRIPIPAVTPRPTRSKPKSLKSEMLDRLSTIDSPEESGGLSSIAWASLVANAAASNGGVRSAKDIPFAYTEKDYDTKSSRRRSRKKLDSSYTVFREVAEVGFEYTYELERITRSA
ncbi:hypothetical protein BDY19DRAFT_1047449 [Irpex rosettiformis]|uniref:Uncharacterized protein n=1 Tax=Irpex rosettiformis TaxID=378272 RepID=A0ACB8U7T2_9APHY|nr:hypothetical protein BDY19DRAFT_1047449 [Irpex rosettiformis]